GEREQPKRHPSYGNAVMRKTRGELISRTGELATGSQHISCNLNGQILSRYFALCGDLDPHDQIFPGSYQPVPLLQEPGAVGVLAFEQLLRAGRYPYLQ